MKINVFEININGAMTYDDSYVASIKDQQLSWNLTDKAKWLKSNHVPVYIISKYNSVSYNTTHVYYVDITQEELLSEFLLRFNV